ncbi:MAG: hypothetical protein WCE44_02210 [Candidatus Velthaea sp.]|jgi:hypothetical protein
MNERDEIRLPDSTGGLFELAFSSYGRRLPLYLGFAFIAFALQGICALASPKNEGVQLAANFVIDGFLCGLVTCGIIADLRSREPRGARSILSDVLARWWVLALVYVVVGVLFTPLLVQLLAVGDPALLALAPVFVLFWGALSFATVVAAVDHTTNEALLPILSIGRSLQVALPFANLGRLALLSLAFLVPLLIQSILQDQLSLRHVRFAEFWAEIPIDVLTIGPLQAIATIFYLDFVRRLATRT